MANVKGDFVSQFDPEEERKMIFEQYKLLAESLNKLNEIRENANNFWIGVNVLGVSALAYLRDNQNIAQRHKSLLFWTIIIIGISFCLSWLSYLKAINDSVSTRNKLLVELEKNLPIPIFSKIFAFSPEKADKPLLTLREMAVPGLFLAGYLFFAVILFFFTHEVICPAPPSS